MKILYLSNSYNVHDHQFLLTMKESGGGIHFVCLGAEEKAFADLPLPDDVQYTTLGYQSAKPALPQQILSLMPKYEELVKRISPTVIHAGPVQSCGFMAAMTGVCPILLMSWGSDILVDAGLNDLTRWITRYTLERADMFFCDCRAVRKAVQEYAPVLDDRIIEIPWGTDLEVFYPTNRNESVVRTLGWEGCFVVVSTRAWEPNYAIHTLLEAFREAVKQNDKLRLILIGNGSFSVSVKQFIVDNRLNSVIVTPGRVSRNVLAEYLRASDLYVSTSLSDGTSVSLLEAMASGLPLVVSDIASNREWITPKENGWLAQNGSAQSFAEFLVQAASISVEERRNMGHRNRKIVEQRADWRKNKILLLETYRRLEMLSESIAK